MFSKLLLYKCKFVSWQKIFQQKQLHTGLTSNDIIIEDGRNKGSAIGLPWAAIPKNSNISFFPHISFLGKITLTLFTPYKYKVQSSTKFRIFLSVKSRQVNGVKGLLSPFVIAYSTLWQSVTFNFCKCMLSLDSRRFPVLGEVSFCIRT